MMRKFFILFVLLTLVTALISKEPLAEKDDTQGVLTLSEARDKVASFQKEMQDVKSRLLLEKQIALSKFQLDNKPLKDKMDTPISPKDEFETSAQYEMRLKRHQENIKPYQRKYQADFNAIVKQYDEKLESHISNFKSQIETLLNNAYLADQLKPVPIEYNADDQVYKLKIIDKDERFWEYYLSVQPKIAREIYRGVDSLRVEGFYANMDALFLIDVTLIHPEVGKFHLKFNTLRSKCKVINFKELIRMLHQKNFFDKVDNKTGEFRNLFEFKTLRGDPVIVDRATGLMWHQTGSSQHMQYEEVNQWIKELNLRGYAGYHDWRLPTAEEAASLLEKSQQNLRHIDPLFSSKQANIWTCDKTDTGGVWFVSFSIGNLADSRGPIDGVYVRPVRSGKVKGKLCFK
ncbi:MAG: DUF1566 domain-containing protein [Candidatus Aminicenantes bacterium]